MKKCLLFILLINFFVFGQAQTSPLGPKYVYYIGPRISKNIDSLHQLLLQAKIDSTRINLLIILSQAYLNQQNYQQNRDSSFWYAQQAMGLSQKINFLKGQFGARTQLAYLFKDAGNYSTALQLALTNLQLSEQYKDTLRIIYINRLLCDIYSEMNDFVKELEYARKNKPLVHSGFFKKESDITNYSRIGYITLMAGAFEKLNQLDSALYYYQLSYKISLSLKRNESLAVATVGLAATFYKTGFYNEAFSYYRMAISYANLSDRKDIIADCYLGLAKLFQQKDQMDSSFFYGMLSLGADQRLKSPDRELETASFLNKLYAGENQMDSAYKYFTMAGALRDSLFNEEKLRQIQNININEALRERQLEEAKREARRQYETKVKIYTLVAGLTVLLLIAFILYLNNRQKQKANLLLTQQKEKIESTLSELKATQAQLIQSEKMASLGELTAGIAHEIQNPLNFVNNFSEVNSELITEMKHEIDKGNLDEVKVIANDIDENEQKIIFHGKRADAIVKGMLQHSRSSSGVKEPTDINALADEYLRLAYHGLRAKDKSFNATMKTDFDETIGNINIIPQDIGRVILNLITNAFYAVTEKKKNGPLTPEGGTENSQNEYDPTVIVTTSLNPPSGGRGAEVLISVKDNGNGIPQKVLDKIFQPFFTTKPTGQGTGLGLSLSYDIIKAHGGEMKVETKEGEGAEFIIQLPA